MKKDSYNISFDRSVDVGSFSRSYYRSSKVEVVMSYASKLCSILSVIRHCVLFIIRGNIGA